MKAFMGLFTCKRRFSDDDLRDEEDDKINKALKVKLMLRRPLNQLVAQGIMPPLKSPPAFYEQRRQLERAKTGDLLKAKIQRRPDRQELERRHILCQQEGHVDPSLAEKQRMLKKARLADALNDQLSHRPGPLELIKKNILHTEEPIEIAVKQGLVAFKATSEGALRRPEHPLAYHGPDEDSPTPSPPSPATTTASTLSPASIAASPRADVVTVPQASAPPPPPPQPCVSHVTLSRDRDRDRNRKKCKSKTTPKARTIKFHEYKGPPNVHKSSSPPLAPGETSYELLLRQQQLFLQWQLESQHKYPQIVFSPKCRSVPISSLPALSPAPSVISVTSISSETSDSSCQQPASPGSPAVAVIPAPPPLPVRLEDMKVSDLKAELKRRGMPVSGPKPTLIERLKPFFTDRCAPMTPPTSNDDCKSEVPSSPASAAGSPESHSEIMDSESQPATPQPAEDIVRSQQRRIEELQRELQRSQQQLEAVKRDAASPAPARRLALHHLQAKIHSHQLAAHIQQLQAMQAAVERRPIATVMPATTVSLTPIAPAIPAPPTQPTRFVLAAEPTSERVLRLVPTGEGLKMQFTLKEGLESIDGIDGFDNKKNVGLVLNGVKVVPLTLVPSEPPPRYEEVARQAAQAITITPPPPPPPPPLPATPPSVLSARPVPSVKSEIVDDVLEILIKNGELPASAANIPSQSCQDNNSQNDDDFMHSGLSECLQHNDIPNHILNSTDIQNNIIDENMQRALLEHNSLQEDLNIIQNELLNSTDLETDLMCQNSHDDNKLHDELLRQANIKDDILETDQYADFIMHGSQEEQNTMQENFLSQNDMADELMDQSSMLMNGHHDMEDSQQNGHSASIDEGSLLDDLIHQNSLNSIHDGFNRSEHDFASISDLSFPDDSMPAINDAANSCHRHPFLNSPSGRCDGLDLKELGLDLESFDTSEANQCTAEPMDTDEWLESLWPRSQPTQCDPLLGGAPTRPAPRPSRQHFSWDRIDFAAT